MRYPLGNFKQKVLCQNGDSILLTSDIIFDGERKKVVAVCRRDRHHLHYIATTGDVCTQTTPERMRWREYAKSSCLADVRVNIQIALAEYHDIAGAIDSHNRVCQALFDIEKAVGTHRWVIRLGYTILGIILTDCRYLYNVTRKGRRVLPPHVFFGKLASELIENEFEETGIERSFVDYYNSDDVSAYNLKDEPRLERSRKTIQFEQWSSPKLRQKNCGEKCGKKTT